MRIVTTRARLYRTLRSAYLERAHVLPEATILYRAKRYDFHESLVEGLNVVQAGPVRAAWLLARSKVITLEINEPLMLSSVWGSALAISGLRVRLLFGGPRATIVSYAMENSNPLVRPVGEEGRLRRFANSHLSRFVWRHTDRIAFGTDAARITYGSALRRPSVGTTSTVIPALPAPCACPVDFGPGEPRVVFLGALVARKGFPELLAAWPNVTALIPAARLTIIGKGTLEGRARQAAEQDPTIELIIDPPRSEIHAHLRRAGVLALPSQPTATWREQIGLPIVEGLAHGCNIVTTSETGLADWLTEHGHDVVAPGAGVPALANAVMHALQKRVGTGAAIVADLPAVDGRLAADAWMFVGAR
ncbi:glycosyltransferase [Cryobacterium sp. Y62]|uniref:glycosyltransferase n=1 Tax=Cryobacterium sp. Y62 TaxID=2048284 RepID=UPI000CE55701|nr:glycosyltransferase [Cryobacterium sp. Y62]